MSKKLRSLIIAGLILGALSVGGISVFASSVNTTNAPTTQSSATSNGTQDSDKGMWKNGGGGFAFKTQDFSSLVTKGIIDQATADKMTTFMTQYKTNMQAEMDKVKAMSDADRKAYFASNKATMDPYAQMVSQGIITQAQSDAIKAAMPTKEEGRGFGFDTSNLVTKGVIDQATADKITAFMTQYKTNMQNNTAQSDPFTQMISQGIITQAQADAIKAAMPTKGDGFRGGRGFGYKFNVSDLVTKGVIDQATADKITAYMNQKEATEQANEANESTGANKTNTQRVDILTDMVNNGVITQDQANAIKAAMPVKALSTNQNSTN